MEQLNFPSFEPRLRDNDGRQEIFDPVRKKFVALTPEEWVRQHVIRYLVDHREVPASLIQVEGSLRFHTLKKRTDIVVFTRSGTPGMIIECKSPSVPVTREVFQQIATYNMTLKVPFLVVTNGMIHYACRIDHGSGDITFLKDIPLFSEIQQNF